MDARLKPWDQPIAITALRFVRGRAKNATLSHRWD